jgi:predicted permease
MGWITRLLRRGRLERELDSELAFHVDAETERLIGEGLPPVEARRHALATFGGLEPIRERTRDARGTQWIEHLWQDLRYGARVLRRAPGFTLGAIASLAIGIGANTAMFSVTDALLFRPLPVERPHELVFLNRAGYSEPNQRFSYPALQRFRQGIPEVPFAAHTSIARTLFSVDGPSELVLGQLVTGNWFDVLGARAEAGRVFTAADTQELGGKPVVVLSDDFWARRFARDPGVIGKTVTINRVPVTVVGVAARGFSGLTIGTRLDCWLPVTMQHELGYYTNAYMEDADDRKPWLTQDGIEFLNIVARLRDGMAHTAVPARMAALHRRSVDSQAEKLADPERREFKRREYLELISAWRGQSPLRETFTEPLQVLMGAAAFVLLIGCANLASLILARGAARSRELSLRLSLGASRGRIVRQLTTESLLLAGLGGLAAVAVARWGADGLLRLAATTRTPIPLSLPFDWRLIAFAGAASLLTGLAFGLMPALRLSRAGLVDGLKTGSRSTSASGRETRVPFGRALIITQVTLALTLLVGAVAFVRTFKNLLAEQSGFEREQVVSARFETQLAGFGAEQWPALSQRLLDAARRVPGVRSASLGVTGTLSGVMRIGGSIVVEGQPPHVGPEWTLREEQVGDDFFATMGMPLVRGRDFRLADRVGAQSVAVINETMARRFFGDVDPIGRHFGYGTPPEFEVVGIVRDARIDGPRSPVPSLAYLPLRQHPGNVANYLYIRVTNAPEAAATALRAALASAEPSLAIREVVTLDELTGRTVARERLMSQLTSGFGLLALAVAALGLYATISYSVVRRTSELGVRLALGASPGSVRWLVLSETLLVVGAGCVIGLLLAVPALRYVGTLLFGLSPGDLVTLVTATATLLFVSVLAALIPAMRAARTDPIRALRSE